MTRLPPPLQRCCAILTRHSGETRSRHRPRWAAALLAACLLTSGCAVPRVPAESGPQSLRDVRGRLEGEWVLERFERRGDTEPWVMVPSRGRLTYDRFGHLSSRGELTDGVPLTSLTYEGRATINPRTRAITVADGTDATAPARKRTFRFDTDGVLVVTLLDGEGRTEARATWRRVDQQPRAATP